MISSLGTVLHSWALCRGNCTTSLSMRLCVRFCDKHVSKENILIQASFPSITWARAIIFDLFKSFCCILVLGYTLLSNKFSVFSDYYVDAVRLSGVGQRRERRSQRGVRRCIAIPGKSPIRTYILNVHNLRQCCSLSLLMATSKSPRRTRVARLFGLCLLTLRRRRTRRGRSHFIIWWTVPPSLCFLMLCSSIHISNSDSRLSWRSLRRPVARPRLLRRVPMPLSRRPRR